MNKVFQAVYVKNWQYDHMDEINRTLIFICTLTVLFSLIAICYLIQTITKNSNLVEFASVLAFFFMLFTAMFRIPYMQGWLNRYRPEGLKNAQNKRVITPNSFAWKIPYLRILGIDNMYASEEEIKKAFRKMASKYHPDHCTDPRTNEYFNTVRQAYEHLVD